METIGIKQDIQKLQMLLGPKLYSNKMSFICEVAQNGTDIHRAMGVKRPIVIGTKRIGSDIVYFQRDYGSGLSKEDFVKYLCTLLESSKSQVKSGEEKIGRAHV